MDCSPPCSSVHGILQARILEWVAISFSRGSSRSGNHIWSIFRDVQLPLLASDQCLESFSFYSILRKTAFFSETAQDAEHFLKLLSCEYGTQAFQKFVSDAPWRWRWWTKRHQHGLVINMGNQGGQGALSEHFPRSFFWRAPVIPLDNSGCLCPWKARFHPISTRFAQRKMVIKPQNLKCMPVFVSWIYTIEMSLNGGNVGVKMNGRTFLLYFEYKICILLVWGWCSVPTGESKIMKLNVS